MCCHYLEFYPLFLMAASAFLSIGLDLVEPFGGFFPDGLPDRVGYRDGQMARIILTVGDLASGQELGTFFRCR